MAVERSQKTAGKNSSSDTFEISEKRYKIFVRTLLNDEMEAHQARKRENRTKYIKVLRNVMRAR